MSVTTLIVWQVIRCTVPFRKIAAGVPLRRLIIPLCRVHEKKPVHWDGLKYFVELLGESRVGGGVSGLSLRIHFAMTTASPRPATKVQAHLDPTVPVRLYRSCPGGSAPAGATAYRRRTLLLRPETGRNPFCIGPA